MRICTVALVALALASILGFAPAGAQAPPSRLALKNGETIQVGSVYWVMNCRSVMIGLPEIEILEGPAGVTLGIKEGEVLPRNQGCAAKVPGGQLMMSVKGITEQTEAKVTYRLSYKTKDGPRQTSNSYIVSLFP
jgi:hypothetical protein